MSINENDVILEVKDLKKHFAPHQSLAQTLTGKNRKVVKAVDGISFAIRRGEIFGLIGESGSGKTTTGKLVMKLIDPTSGSIGFKIKDVLEEPLIIHKLPGDHLEHEKMIIKALTEVKLNPPEEYMGRFPHMLSGGQRQRIATARTLILNPLMLVADEPVSMIDLSTRAEILHMMKDVQRDLGLTSPYITHDLSTARYFTDRIAVMYLGRIVEMGNADDVIDNPLHPYTKALIDAVPEPETGKVDIIKELPISGEIPSPANIPPGCRFHTRCPYAKPECSAEAEPELMDVGNGHYHACRRYKEI